MGKNTIVSKCSTVLGVYKLLIHGINSAKYSSALLTWKLLVRSASLAWAVDRACSALHSFWVRLLVSCSKRCFAAITWKTNIVIKGATSLFKLLFLNSTFCYKTKLHYFIPMNPRVALLLCGEKLHIAFPLLCFRPKRWDVSKIHTFLDCLNWD